MRGVPLSIAVLVAVLAAALAPGALAAAERPNIVVILADDYGYGSLNCYGGTGLRTPNLDRLAREGRKFTQAYCPGSVCSPTRYGLMTGRYYWRTRIKDGEVLPYNAPLHIETDRLTLAALCKGQGYRTAAFGKWHLGFQAGVRQTDWNRPLTPGPLEIGFDHFFGLAANPWNGPHSFLEDHAITGVIPGQPIVVTPGREQASTSGIARPWQENEITRTLTDHAVAWIEQNRQGPFFVYFAPNAVHRPVAPNPAFTGSQFGSYGDFIEELDGSVGRILDALDRLGCAGKTLVLLSSDNGGVINPNVEESAFAIKAGLAINGPLRGGKHDIWEGGFRVPFLVRWPGKIPAGTTSPQVLCLTDVLATLAGILDVPLTPGQAEDSFDAGRALVEATPGAPVRDHVIVQDAHATYAIRAGDWKLVERVSPPPFEFRNANAQKKFAAARRKEPRHDELFDLAADPAEANDRHATEPDVVTRLRATLASVRERGASRPGAAP
jgi:arylsulfatase A-like enzyme